jgi:hypothetical protein
MLGIHDLWLFIASGLLLSVTPGPDTAYIAGRSVQLGWRGGVAAALGISTGCLVHVSGGAIGLSALLLLDGLCRREMGRRGLSLLHRYDDAVVASASKRFRRRR